MSNPNTNCLEGMSCPKCGSRGPFFIAATVMVKVTDEGSEPIDGNHEWHDDTHATCGDHECAFAGTVLNFSEEGRTA